MKRCLIIFLCFGFVHAIGQTARVTEISLPAEIAYFDNQISGLYISQKKLYLLAESRLQENQSPQIFVIETRDLKRKLKDSSFVLPYQKLPIEGLEPLREKMDHSGNRYEGIESMVIEGDEIYLSVETTTLSPDCFLLRGKLQAGKITLANDYFQVKKPRLNNGAAVFNAGFEAMAKKRKALYLFYEYNYFNRQNQVYKHHFTSTAHGLDSVPIAKMPFRITDITKRCGSNFIALNYFFRGDTMTNGYVIDSNDIDFQKSYKDGKFTSFARLINLKIKNDQISWKPFWSIPEAYHGYNWEGIAKYKKGYLLVNDKYTPARPYITKLVFLSSP